MDASCLQCWHFLSTALILDAAGPCPVRDDSALTLRTYLRNSMTALCALRQKAAWQWCPGSQQHNAAWRYRRGLVCKDLPYFHFWLPFAALAVGTCAHLTLCWCHGNVQPAA